MLQHVLDLIQRLARPHQVEHQRQYRPNAPCMPSGVNPIVVSTECLPATAASETPLPKWQVITLRLQRNAQQFPRSHRHIAVRSSGTRSDESLLGIERTRQRVEKCTSGQSRVQAVSKTPT